jgi:hypothetical protein
LQRQLKQKVFTKVIKTPDWIAWIQGPSDLIKKRVEVEGERITLIKEKNISREQLSVINLNYYRILILTYWYSYIVIFNLLS